jgi:hypothetical protein
MKTTMKKEITFTIGKTKETIELSYDTKFIQPVQKIMKKLSKENPDADIWAHWEVESDNEIQKEIGGWDYLESYNYRQEAKKL